MSMPTLSGVQQLAVVHADGDVFSLIDNLGNKTTTAAYVIGGIVAVVILVVGALAKKTLAGAVTAFIVAAFVVFAIHNVNSPSVQNPLKNTIQQDGSNG